MLQEPGQKLRRVRERLRLRYRDVEEASEKIAGKHQNDEFVIGLSRLADIENKGTLPSIYRLYSLCAIYRLDLGAVLRWYGVELDQLAIDAARIMLEHTHLIELKPSNTAEVTLPAELSGAVDLRRTFYLSRHIQRWGAFSATLLNSLEPERHRYAFIGTDDWTMYPVIAPGSFVQIDESRRKVASDGWTHELERPIYFVEHRTGYACGWCADRDGWLIVQPHSASPAAPQMFARGQAEVVGQVIAVAMRLDVARRRHTRS
ncbi:MAG: hypothetical protein JOZ62_04320 [Acidobacteriaceae bacterium]|nr:hypothetical protein [Acidobacteriaceae bacterium]